MVWEYILTWGWQWISHHLQGCFFYIWDQKTGTHAFNQDTRLPKFNMEPTMMVSKFGISYSRVLFTGSMFSIGSKVCWGVQSFLSNIFLRGLKKKQHKLNIYYNWIISYPYNQHQQHQQKSSQTCPKLGFPYPATSAQLFVLEPIKVTGDKQPQKSGSLYIRDDTSPVLWGIKKNTHIPRIPINQPV